MRISMIHRFYRMVVTVRFTGIIRFLVMYRNYIWVRRWWRRWTDRRWWRLRFRCRWSINW